MFLSRVLIDPYDRGSWYVLSTPQRLHAAVVRAFSQDLHGDLGGGPRALWRVDEDPTGRTVLLLASPYEPDLGSLVKQLGPDAAQSARTKDYAPLLDKIDEGQQWRFRLTANPVSHYRAAADQRTKRYPAGSDAKRVQWLTGQGDRCGFAVRDVTATRPNGVWFEHQGGAIRFEQVRFDGHLVVTDPDALRTAMVRGIGPQKAHGCGLLTIAKS
jgi:CRISPR system Cascade subunit CasE